MKKPNIRSIRKLYGPTAQLKLVRDLKPGDLLIRQMIGGIKGNPGLMVSEVKGVYPSANAQFFVTTDDSLGRHVDGDRWALVSVKGSK